MYYYCVLDFRVCKKLGRVVFVSIIYVLGKLELENLPLKKDALKKLNFPVEVRSGKLVQKCHYKTPSFSLTGQTCDRVTVFT